MVSSEIVLLVMEISDLSFWIWVCWAVSLVLSWLICFLEALEVLASLANLDLSLASAILDFFSELLARA